MVPKWSTNLHLAKTKDFHRLKLAPIKKYFRFGLFRQKVKKKKLFSGKISRMHIFVRNDQIALKWIRYDIKCYFWPKIIILSALSLHPTKKKHTWIFQTYSKKSCLVAEFRECLLSTNSQNDIKMHEYDVNVIFHRKLWFWQS